MSTVGKDEAPGIPIQCYGEEEGCDHLENPLRISSKVEFILNFTTQQIYSDIYLRKIKTYVHTRSDLEF
jgi:hypothetical protein